MKKENARSCIDLYINSPVGSVTSGPMIHDVINGLSCKVNMYCVGMTAGCIPVVGYNMGAGLIIQTYRELESSRYKETVKIGKKAEAAKNCA